MALETGMRPKTPNSDAPNLPQVAERTGPCGGFVAPIQRCSRRTDIPASDRVPLRRGRRHRHSHTLESLPPHRCDGARSGAAVPVPRIGTVICGAFWMAVFPRHTGERIAGVRRHDLVD